MKIGLFIKDFAVGKEFDKTGVPIKSGAEFQGENHAKQLIKQGHEVYIMAKKRYWWTKGREGIGRIDLVRLHNPLRWLEILIRLHITHRHTDAFYIIGTPAFAVWCILYARINKIPVTLALTGKAEIFDAKANWRNKLLAQCNNYIAISNEIKQGLCNKANVPSNDIYVLPQGIDTTRFIAVSAEKKKILKEKMGILSNKRILLFCARVVINKGIDILEQCWELLYKETSDIILMVVGGGNKELLEELRCLGKKHNGALIVVGEVHDPLEYYQIADVYILPSRYEGLPTTVMEALSCEVPAVVSDIGGCEDLVQEGVNGFRVAQEKPSEFAEKIQYLFTHEKERLAMGSTGRHLIQTTCDYKVVVPELEKIILQGCDRYKDER